LEISGIGIEIEVDFGVGEIFRVFGRDLAHDIVGELGFTSAGGTDDQTWVTHL